MDDLEVTGQSDQSPRTDAERRLATLAARLVLECGVSEAQKWLLVAAGRSDSALQRIATFSGASVLAPRDHAAAPQLRMRQTHRARTIATKIDRLARVSDAPQGKRAVTSVLQPGPVGGPESIAEATQLFMLLAVTRGESERVALQQPAKLGRQLVAILLSDQRVRRYVANAACPAAQRTAHLHRYPLTLVFYSMAIVAYLLLRFRGHYVEQDTAEMTQLIEAVAAYGNAIPASGVHPVYPSGFGFQAVNIYLMRLSGADIQTLETWVWPFLLVGIALVAFSAFREITWDDRSAALGGLFLFLQPDFLFTALRGSHEKMTYCMLLAALFLLFRSYRHRHQLFIFAGYVILFYLVLLGIICTNSTFGSSLIIALTLSFFGGAFVSRLLGCEAGTGNRALIRLAYISFSSFLVLFAEIFYFYEPSISIFNQFQSAIDRIANFALSFESGNNPYAYISLGWLNTEIYLLLTTFTWLTIAVSGFAWCRLTLRFFRGGWRDAPDYVRLGWLLYAGLAVQVGLGIGVDFAGVLGANLQLRLFPVFMFLAIPTGSAAIVGLLDRAGTWPVLRQTLRLGVAATTVAFTAFSTLKATNEPLLSNKWTFYSTTEAQAMDWLDVNAPQSSVWSDVDERLREVDLFRSPPTEEAGSRYPTLLLPEQVDIVMLSDNTRARMARIGSPLPDVSHMNEVYDNDLVQVYRQLPLTPLQH